MYAITYTYMPQLSKPSQKPDLFASALCSSLDIKEFFAAFCSLKARFKKHPRPRSRKRPYYDRVFNPWITLWAMILQRVLANHSLQETLAHLRDGKADRLSGCKSKSSFACRAIALAKVDPEKSRLCEMPAISG